MEWTKSNRTAGGMQLNYPNCEGWVYYRKGYWVGEYIELPNLNGSIGDIFNSEADAKKWCEHKCLVQQVVWTEDESEKQQKQKSMLEIWLEAGERLKEHK